MTGYILRTLPMSDTTEKMELEADVKIVGIF